MNVLLNKGRRPKFELTLKIIDLNNVPIVSGSSFVKWHLPSSTSAEHRGKTDLAPIKEHKVLWDYSKTLMVRLSMDKSNMLQDCLIHFEVIHDYPFGASRERIILGIVSLNLSEYVEAQDGSSEEEGITRRYLMHESKINSTLKISISMMQVDGERNFTAPPLKTAFVFQGIAGIVNGPDGEGDDIGAPTAKNIHRSWETGELQDMYRTALSASWAAQAGELPPDKCIEDIFAGGTGWGLKDKQDEVPNPRLHRLAGDQNAHFADYERWLNSKKNLHRKASGSSLASRSAPLGKPGGCKDRKSNEQGDLRVAMNDASVGMGLRPASSDSNTVGRRRGFKFVTEVNEFDARDNLVSWQIPETAA